MNLAVYTTGTPVAPNTPTSSGGAVVSYLVSPALPAGLSLNTSTDVISGTPSAVSPATTYTITATNSTGSTTARLGIAVDAAVIAPIGLTYADAPAGAWPINGWGASDLAGNHSVLYDLSAFSSGVFVIP